MANKIRYFKIIDPDDPDGLPGLWKSLGSSKEEVDRSIAALRQTGLGVEEIDRQTDRRIRQQHQAAERQAAQEERGTMSQRNLSYEEWIEEGKALFGEDADMLDWKFVCPACGHIASARDYKAAGATEGAVAFSCIGRWLPTSSEAFSKKPGPCNYAGGGLLKVHPLAVAGRDVFDFARPQKAGGANGTNNY